MDAPVTTTEALNTQQPYEDMVALLREKILFGLRIYPALNPSMLHVFLGTATPKNIWKDVVLEGLIQEGLVCKVEVTLVSPNERTQTYSVLHLAETAYTPPQRADQPEDTTL